MSCGVGHRCGLYPALLCLWQRSAAVALIGPLAWEPPYAVSTALKRQKKKKKKSKKVGSFYLLKEKLGVWTWDCLVNGRVALGRRYRYFESMSYSNIWPFYIFMIARQFSHSQIIFPLIIYYSLTGF